MGDSNAAAQDKALDALLAWTRASSDGQVERLVTSFFVFRKEKGGDVDVDKKERASIFLACIPLVLDLGKRVFLVQREIVNVSLLPCTRDA